MPLQHESGSACAMNVQRANLALQKFRGASKNGLLTATRIGPHTNVGGLIPAEFEARSRRTIASRNSD